MKDTDELITSLIRDSDDIFGDIIWHKRTMEIFMNEELCKMIMDHLNTFPKELVSVTQVFDKIETGKFSIHDHFGYEGIGLFKIIPDMDRKKYLIQKLY